MFIESLRLRNFRCFGDVPTVLTFEPGLTVIVGANGAGKTAIIAALQKLFGSRADERRLTREDLHFGAGEEPGVPEAPASESAIDVAELLGIPEAPSITEEAAQPDQPLLVQTRDLEIEVVVAFPEIQAAGVQADAVPEVFKAMSVAGPGEPPKVRLRLEATWNYGLEEDDISSRLYWITSLAEVPFGERDIAKINLSSGDRKRFSIRYLPATRDGNAIVRQALKELLAWLERFGDWSAGRESMSKQWQQLQELFDEMPAIDAVTAELAVNWGRLFEGPHLRRPKLTVLAREIQRAIRELSLSLGPAPSGRHRSVHDLSEGQASLFYIALVVTLLRMDEKLAANVPVGFKDQPTLRPWLTILALEEPENHLGPFYLSRMVSLMSELSKAPKVMGVLTTHSPSTLRRVKPSEVRHVRLDPVTLNSKINGIRLPPKTADEYKFIQEAVTSQPELYFAKLVILGEGRSEDIVLPHVARVLDSSLELDPAFVAFVPLGGRHVNHFWRLLDALKIPYLTLLDYDLGRSGAGPLRLKYAVDQLEELGVSPAVPLVKPADAQAWKALSAEEIAKWLAWLRVQGVFYSADLDLDMMMLRAFPDQYGKVSEIDSPKEGANYQKSVFGEAGAGVAAYDVGAPTPLELARYDALFKKGSKPVAHVEALSELPDDVVVASCPEPLRALFERCRLILGLVSDDAEMTVEPTQSND